MKSRIEFEDGTWGILVANTDIEDFPGEMELGKYLIDRGFVNSRSEQILDAHCLIPERLWIVHGRNR